ncbi:hypothetical protein LTR84_010442 [Exophiala bonariae]|uniref:F-box domain-containing protein n=1 Tax=Exophiala bonariae TaxID=1690606 RepID=A0AAV9MT61_9EURO|nr:hypothetical protein LTR84_010442 [Exophiala bonariae]
MVKLRFSDEDKGDPTVEDHSVYNTEGSDQLLSNSGGQPLPVVQQEDQISPSTSDATCAYPINKLTPIETDYPTTTKQPPNLLTIPVEVRKLILRHLLSTDMAENSRTFYHHQFNEANIKIDEITVDRSRRNYRREQVEELMNNNCVVGKKYKLHINVLWTCKQLFSEGSTILLSENKHLAIKHVTPRKYMKSFLNECGVETFWIHPAILESTRPSQFQPIITLDLRAIDRSSDQRKLGRVCKAISLFMAVAVSRTFVYFSVNLEIRASSLLAGKGRGSKIPFSYLQRNLFDWIGQIVGQITFVGPYSNLPKEDHLRSWLLQQLYSMCIPTLRRPAILAGTRLLSAARLPPFEQWGTEEMRGLVRRFREAEMEFLCNRYAAAFEAFGNLSALVMFLSLYECRPSQFDARVQELLLWSHFYMGLSLVEEKDAAARFIYDARKESRRMTSAAWYLPQVDSWKSQCPIWHFQCIVTPGQEVRLLFAKAEVSCKCPFQKERIPRCKRYTEQAMALMTSGQSTLDFKEIKGLCASPKFTIVAFQNAKAGIKQSIAQHFGPLLPVTLTFEPDI